MQTTTDLSWIDRLPERAGAGLKNQAKDIAGLRESADYVVETARSALEVAKDEARKLRRIAGKNERALLSAIAELWAADDIAAAKRASVDKAAE